MGMRLRGRLRALAVSTVAVLVASFATAGMLDDFRTLVETRRDAVRRGSPRRVALARAARHLGGGGLLVDQVRAGFLAVRSVESRFRRDAEFDGAEAQFIATLGAALAADRDVLDARRGTLGDEAAESRLVDQLTKADADLVRAAGASRPVSALKALRDAAVHLRNAFPPKPDFSMRDVNPASATYDTDVSPRDFAEKFSAYYFGHAT